MYLKKELKSWLRRDLYGKSLHTRAKHLSLFSYLKSLLTAFLNMSPKHYVLFKIFYLFGCISLCGVIWALCCPVQPSLVVAWGLRCSTSCGIIGPQPRIELTSLGLGDRFLTSRPQGSPCLSSVNYQSHIALWVDPILSCIPRLSDSWVPFWTLGMASHCWFLCSAQVDGNYWNHSFAFISNRTFSGTFLLLAHSSFRGQQ